MINILNISGEVALLWHSLNTLRPRQNGRHFPDDTFKRIFMNDNVWISIKVSLKFVPKGSINNITALVQIMAWRRPGNKPLSEPMMVNLPTHICVTRPQWVNIGSGNGMVPSGTTPLPEPMLSYFYDTILTHWGRVMHICVGNRTINGSDNGLGAKPLSEPMLEFR